MIADLRRQIELRAYLIWGMAGRPEGNDLAHWLEAQGATISARATPIRSDCLGPAKAESGANWSENSPLPG